MYKISHVYEQYNTTVDVINGDRLVAISTGTIIYLDNEPVFVVPTHLCIKKLTADEAVEEKQKLKDRGW